MSKIYKESEIRGYLTIDGRKVTYLKDGVKRQFRYINHYSSDNLPQLNQELIDYEKWEEFYKLHLGQDDFENN